MRRNFAFTTGPALLVLVGCGHPAAERIAAAERELQARYTYLIGRPLSELQSSSSQRGETPKDMKQRKAGQDVLWFGKVSVPLTSSLDPSTCALTVGVSPTGTIEWVLVQGADFRYLDFEDRATDLAVCARVIDKIVPPR